MSAIGDMEERNRKDAYRRGYDDGIEAERERVLGALKVALADAATKSREAHDKYDGQWHGRDPCNTPDAKKNTIEECITIINQHSSVQEAGRK